MGVGVGGVGGEWGLGEVRSKGSLPSQMTRGGGLGEDRKNTRSGINMVMKKMMQNSWSSTSAAYCHSSIISPRLFSLSTFRVRTLSPSKIFPWSISCLPAPLRPWPFDGEVTPGM